jgi:transposase
MATRRTHPLEFKRSAVDASNQPGASMAGVAMAHGINVNQLHKWRRQLRDSGLVVAKPDILPVTMIDAAGLGCLRQAAPEGSIDIQLPGARLLVRGQVDPDVLQTVLVALRSR